MPSITPMFLDSLPPSLLTQTLINTFWHVFEIMRVLHFIGFLLIWLKTDKRKCPPNNLVIYVFTQHFFFFQDRHFVWKNKTVSGQGSLYFGHGNLLKGHGEVMEKSLKLSERAYMKPGYLTQNAKKASTETVLGVWGCVHLSCLSEQLSVNVVSAGLESWAEGSSCKLPVKGSLQSFEATRAKVLLFTFAGVLR